MEFPKLGSTVKRKLVESEDSPFHGIELEIKLVGAPKARSWSMRFQQNRIVEIRRLAALRKGFSRDEAPEFWEPHFYTPEGIEDLIKLGRDVIADAVVSVTGGGVPGDMTPADALEQLGALEHAMNIVIIAQSPKSAQLLS